jgi:hypothetical protein
MSSNDESSPTKGSKEMSIPDWVRSLIHPQVIKEVWENHRSSYEEMATVAKRQREIANRLRRLQVEAELYAHREL